MCISHIVSYYFQNKPIGFSDMSYPIYVLYLCIVVSNFEGINVSVKYTLEDDWYGAHKVAFF